MTINNVQKIEVTASEKPPVTVQNDVQKEITKETFGSTPVSTQKQVLQALSYAQPIQQIQQTAQNQISKGYLDIRV